MTTVLLSAFYEDPDATRRGELLECLRRNVTNDELDEIHVFIEEPRALSKLRAAYPVFENTKIRLIAHERRVTYRDLFAYANRHLPDWRVIIANADIYFDHTLARLDGYDLAGKLLCLSRWDIQPDGAARFFDHPGSQDAWIFQAPIRELTCDFHMGLLGCDNRLAWEAAHAGLTLSNPSRSLRAYHLHLSSIRRYNPRQRLPGPALSVPAEFLGTPWLWFVVPCMGRLADLCRTADSLLGQPRSSYVLVDYSCPDGAGSWAREHQPGIVVVAVGGRRGFHGAEARNHGAAVVDDDGIICFLDADMCAADGFSDYVLDHLDAGTFLIPDRRGSGFDSALVCRKADFDRIHGFDEAMLGWGSECGDLEAMLRRAGMAECRIPAGLLAHVGHHAQATQQLPRAQDRETNHAIHAAYRRAKTAILDETGGNGVSVLALRAIYVAIAQRHSGAMELARETPCASVAFREAMGYTIARLDIGVSSHNNDLRPFSTIPAPLRGMPFTQVVASSVSHIEIKFLTAGKLYILVGDDWDGTNVATAWLVNTSIREGLPPLRTSRGTGFEVWALIGQAAERFVLPTQVMLVAASLVRL